MSDMAFAAQSRGRPAGVVTVAELLRRVSGGRLDKALPAPPQPSDQVWVGTLLRREGVSPQEALGTSTAPTDGPVHGPLKKAAVTAGALLAVGALGVSAAVVVTSHDEGTGQSLLDGLSPAQLGQLPLDAAAAAAGAGANLFTALVPGILPEAAALISGAVNATTNAISGANGLPFTVPGLPGAPAASGASGSAVSPSTATAGDGGSGSTTAGGGTPGGGAAAASSGPVDNTVGAAGRTVGGTASNVGSALPQPVGQPVQQLGGAVSDVSTGVSNTADSVVAPVGSLLGGLAR